MLMRGFLFLATLVISTLSYKCPSTVAAPDDLTRTTYYPPTWSEGQPIPTLDSYQHCLISVTVPDGYLANVTFYRQYVYNEGSYVIYTNNKISQIRNNDHNPFIFVSPQFKVNIKASNTTDPYQFAFKVQYFPTPNYGRVWLGLYPDSPPDLQLPNEELYVYETSSNSKAALMGFSLADPSMNYLLRRSVIFSSNTFHDTKSFLGTLEHIMQNGFPLISPTKYVSIYTFDLYNIIDYPIFMGQDYTDARKFKVYHGASCPSTGKCRINLNGKYGDAMVVTFSQQIETLLGFDNFADKAVITVYNNTYTRSEDFVASFANPNDLQQLPLKVIGPVRFYKLTGYGEYNMTLTRETL